MSARSKGREIALQALYQLEWGDWEDDPEEALLSLLETAGPGRLDKEHPSVRFALQLLEGILENRDKIDGVIQRYARNWRLERMAMVDRNILRIGVYELLFSDDVPPKVAINEAVELGKRFGAEDSAPFVNGILDAVHKRERGA